VYPVPLSALIFFSRFPFFTFSLFFLSHFTYTYSCLSLSASISSSSSSSLSLSFFLPLLFSYFVIVFSFSISVSQSIFFAFFLSRLFDSPQSLSLLLLDLHVQVYNPCPFLIVVLLYLHEYRSLPYDRFFGVHRAQDTLTSLRARALHLYNVCVCWVGATIVCMLMVHVCVSVLAVCMCACACLKHLLGSKACLRCICHRLDCHP
jgi:hypothetical protein